MVECPECGHDLDGRTAERIDEIEDGIERNRRILKEILSEVRAGATDERLGGTAGRERGPGETDPPGDDGPERFEF